MIHDGPWLIHDECWWGGLLNMVDSWWGIFCSTWFCSTTGWFMTGRWIYMVLAWYTPKSTNQWRNWTLHREICTIELGWWMIKTLIMVVVVVHYRCPLLFIAWTEVIGDSAWLSPLCAGNLQLWLLRFPKFRNAVSQNGSFSSWVVVFLAATCNCQPWTTQQPRNQFTTCPAAGYYFEKIEFKSEWVLLGFHPKVLGTAGLLQDVWQ